MQQQRNRSGVISGILLPVGLICVFAFCSLALALMGGRAYKSIQAGIDDSYGSTVAASYLRTKVVQNNAAGAVALREWDGTQVLVIRTEADGRRYETRIYLWEDALLESFVPAENDFEAGAGVAVARLRGCRFAISDDGLFTAELESLAGEKTRTAVALVQEAGV